MNAPHCYVYMYVAYLVPPVFAVIGAYGNFLRAIVVFIFERFFFLVGAAACACSDLQVKLSKQFTPLNMGMKGFIRFLFLPNFLLQFSVSSVAFPAVISTFLLCITHLPQYFPMYLWQ